MATYHGSSGVCVHTTSGHGESVAKALKAPAWAWARATGCDLQSGSRKSMRVWGPFLFFALSFSTSLPVSPFLRCVQLAPPTHAAPSTCAAPLLSTFERLVSSKVWFSPRHHQCSLYSIFSEKYVFTDPKLSSFYAVFAHFLSHCSLQWIPKPFHKVERIKERLCFSTFWDSAFQNLTSVLVKPGLIVKRFGA